MNEWIDIAVIGVALAVAFLLSGMEAGVFALSRFRLRRMARHGNRRAALLQRYLDDPESFLWTILVGNTLAALVVVTAVALRVERWWAGRGGWFMPSMVGLLLLFYLFADLLPKVLFRRFPNRLSIIGVAPFRLLHGLLAPVVGLTKRVSRAVLRLTGGQAFTGRLFGSRAEFRQVIEDSGQALTREEVVMINRILDLQNRRVRDVMTPMHRAVTLETGQKVGDLLRLVRERPVSYLPLWQGGGGQRRILGVVVLADLLHAADLDEARPLGALVRPAVYVEDDARLEDALRTLQRGRQRTAIVMDAQRREVGVITLNDILRVMFGEVRV